MTAYIPDELWCLVIDELARPIPVYCSTATGEWVVPQRTHIVSALVRLLYVSKRLCRLVLDNEHAILIILSVYWDRQGSTRVNGATITKDAGHREACHNTGFMFRNCIFVSPEPHEITLSMPPCLGLDTIVVRRDSTEWPCTVVRRGRLTILVDTIAVSTSSPKTYLLTLCVTCTKSE